MEKNLIVTGSSGLVGSEIVELLSKDFNQVFGNPTTCNFRSNYT